MQNLGQYELSTDCILTTDVASPTVISAGSRSCRSDFGASAVSKDGKKIKMVENMFRQTHGDDNEKSVHYKLQMTKKVCYVLRARYSWSQPTLPVGLQEVLCYKSILTVLSMGVSISFCHCITQSMCARSDHCYEIDIRKYLICYLKNTVGF